MLDLSAAFDTVNHKILLERLEHNIDISGVPLQWFKSYLSNRSQRIAVQGKLSRLFDLDCGVPQGSCLASLLYVIYALKLFNININSCTATTSLATCLKANSIQDPAPHFQGYLRSLSSLHQWTYSCQTQIYLRSPLTQKYSAATSYTENAAYTWCSLLCCCCPCVLEQTACWY